MAGDSVVGDVATPAEEPLVPLPDKGRVFRRRRRVRLADAAPSGEARLDAYARYLQDIGNDDTADSGLDGEGGAWVVRRAVIDVNRPPQWGEWLDLATWCGGTGRRWAERRLSIQGEQGASVEMTTLWIHIDPVKLLPLPLPALFTEIYGEATAGRKVSSKLWLPREPVPEPVTSLIWPLRTTDFDLMRHLNNAVYWEAVEEVLVQRKHPLRQPPVRAVLEYAQAVPMRADVTLIVADRSDSGQDRTRPLDIWFTVDDAVHASARVFLR